MTIATIMVSLAFAQSNDARIAIAGELAERFEASVIGVAAAQFTPPLYFTSGEQAQDLIDQGEAAIREKLAELETQFRAAIEGRARTVMWRGALDFPARYVLGQACAADIIVSGGPSPAFSDAFALASPKDLVLQAGRPLLVVPDNVSWLDRGTALVAWKDTAEARRAIADSLPFLRKAKNVVIAEVLENVMERAPAEARLADVAAWLSRHGVTASVRTAEPSEGRDVAAELDAIAADVAASLVIAGAYGHSRFRELVLGGVTQHLITKTSRCVLLSH
jgi:nucleotide-binding universal stress UspA family protein